MFATIFLVAILVLVGPVMGFVLDHRGHTQGHRLGNIIVVVFVIGGFALVAFFRTNLPTASLHVFDSLGTSHAIAADMASPLSFGHDPKRKATRRHATETAESAPAGHSSAHMPAQKSDASGWVNR